MSIGVLLVACNESAPTGTLVGFYGVQGVLVENSCGQSALPAVSPLKFDVQIREDGGVGYWSQTKQAQSTGSLNSRGEFRFSTSLTKVVSSGQPGQTQLQPSNFTSLQPDFDLQQRSCALTVRETITGSVQRRNAADGGAIVEVSAADAAVGGSNDLEAEHLIEVTPSAGSDCNLVLAAFGGNYLALPCGARYVLHGNLQAATSTGAPAGAAAPPATP
jgi:hypothetical protein